MRSALLALAVVLAAALTGLAAEPVDILSVTPESLSGADAVTLAKEANTAYQESRYEDAARAFIAILERKPGDSGSLYNLACCYGLLGHAEQAARFLEASFKAGFTDLEHIRRDPDFDKVRESEAMKLTMARLEKEGEKLAKSAGKPLSVTVPVVADVRVFAPTAPATEGRLPLLVALHGHGSTADSFAGLFAKRDLSHAFLYCVVQAPYAFPSTDPIGWSWSFEGPGADYAMRRQSEELSEDLVLKAVEAVKAAYPVDERNVFLLGFSQGAGMAFTIGLRHPQLFRGVIPIGGWVDSRGYSDTQLAKAEKAGCRFLVCHSEEDRVVPFEAATEAMKFLGEEDIAGRLLTYAGGHQVPKELLERILRFIAAPEKDPDAPPQEGR